MSPICIEINRYNEKNSVGKKVFFGIVFSVLPGYVHYMPSLLGIESFVEYIKNDSSLTIKCCLVVSGPSWVSGGMPLKTCHIVFQEHRGDCMYCNTKLRQTGDF